MKERPEVRSEVYDWLRGLGSIAVVLGHYKIFDLSKSYFLWSVHTFVLVTVVLAAQSPLNFQKLVRRLAYLFYVYAILTLLFWLIYCTQAILTQQAFPAFPFGLQTAIFKNPYFDQLWYLVLHVQLLVFFVLFGDKLSKLSPKKVLISTFLFSQALFLVTYFVLERFNSILLPSWLFVIAVSWYVVPKAVEKLRRADEKRGLRCLIALGILGLIYSQAWLKEWLRISEARLFVLNTGIFLFVLYFLMELFFLLEKKYFFQPLKKAVLLMSRYTLIIYIFHQGVGQMVHPSGANALAWSVFSITTGAVLGHWIHRSYLWLEGLKIKDNRSIEVSTRLSRVRP